MRIDGSGTDLLRDPQVAELYLGGSGTIASARPRRARLGDEARAARGSSAAVFGGFVTKSAPYLAPRRRRPLAEPPRGTSGRALRRTPATRRSGLEARRGSPRAFGDARSRRSHVATCSRRISGWNWMPQAASPSRNACEHTRDRASSTAPVGHLERVLVHLEHVEDPRQRAEDRIVAPPRRVSVTGTKPASGSGRRPDVRARRLREQLPAEADAEQRHPPRDEPTDQLVFHRAATDARPPGRRSCARRRRRTRRTPRAAAAAPRRRRPTTPRASCPSSRDDVGEQLRANERAVGQRQDPHQKSVAFACAGSIAPVASTPASSSSPRSTCALRGA